MWLTEKGGVYGPVGQLAQADMKHFVVLTGDSHVCVVYVSTRGTVNHFQRRLG